jgi:hypothetical protein
VLYDIDGLENTDVVVEITKPFDGSTFMITKGDVG